MPPRDALHRIYAAEREILAAEADLLATPPHELRDLLSAEVDAALSDDDPIASAVRARRLADLCAQVQGAKMADALIRILDHADPSVRAEAGHALLDVAFERFKEVARAVEKVLDEDHEGLGMQELPFVLTEIRDPDPIPLVARFLAHPDPAVVASAIEAMAAYGDPGAAKHLEPLLEDDREATLEDLDEGPTVIGELAAAALEELGIEQ